MDRLAATLERETEALEELRYRLVILDCLVAVGRTTLLDRATDEVDLALGEARHLELARAIELARVADGHGLAFDATLAEVLAATSGDVRRRLDLAGRRLRRLNAQVDELSSGARARALGQLRAARTGLLADDEPPTPRPGLPADDEPRA